MARELTDPAIREQIAVARARAASAPGVRASSARYDPASGRLEVELTNGCMIAFPADLGQGLRGAHAEDLAEVEVVLGGRALRWERLDADLSVAGLVGGLFGSRAWMQDIAREMGRHGGRARGGAKAAAARRNGRKGGRPRRE
jgi:Protein of unknown function (DUF2442)